MKINKPGLALRKKSKIHELIIDEKTGRRKKDVSSSVKRVISDLKSSRKENWGNNGYFLDIPSQEVLKKALFKKFGSSKTNDKNVFILGPGKGFEIIFVKSLFKDINVDTFGLSHNLSPQAKLLVRRDFSPEKIDYKKVFEHVNHLSLVGKYDFIYSSLGPTTHTNYPEIVVLKIATLLRPGGVALIPYIKNYNINYNKLVKEYGLNNFKIKFDKSLNLYIKRIK